MTDKEEYELGRLQAATFTELAKYVEGLLEAELQYGYDSGWDESEKHRERR